MKIEEIESIEFWPVGMEQPYKYEYQVVNHPLQNVAGLTRIGNNYYKKIPLKIAWSCNKSRKSSFDILSKWIFPSFPH